MLYKIEIENFYSIRNTQVLDLRVPANAPNDNGRLASCWKGSSERAPKAVAVFGANGSGKSNLLRALSFGAWFISSSFGLDPHHPMPYAPFNDDESSERPTRLKCWSSLQLPSSLGNQNDGIEYPSCYELIFANGNNRVVSESIFYWPTPKSRKTRLIERFEDGTVKAAKGFGLSGYKQALEKILRPNASVLSTLAQLNHPVAAELVDRVRTYRYNIFIEKDEFDENRVLEHYIDHSNMSNRFNREINRIDVGVRALEIHEGKNGPEVFFRHEGLSRPMPPLFESHGTRQFLKLYPLIFDALSSGSVVVIDELDAAIHSMILPEIFSWFYDPVRNPYGAQLWASCHNVSLLEDLSKDEIVFCEKDLQGKTDIYSLNDIRAVRRDDNFYKKYLGGVFGAVPRLG